MANSTETHQHKAAYVCPKREKQRAIVTYIMPELYEAMHEIAWRKRMTITAVVTRAIEDFVKKPIKSSAPPLAQERACANRAEKRTVTAYLDPELFDAMHDVVWRRRTTMTAATACAISDFVKKHSKTPAPA
jgi:hypothetical protein